MIGIRDRLVSQGVMRPATTARGASVAPAVRWGRANDWTEVCGIRASRQTTIAIKMLLERPGRLNPTEFVRFRLRGDV